MNSMNIKYGLLQGLYWAAYCTVYAFFVPLLESFGYQRMTISLLSMCATACLALAQPLWGILLDRLPRVKPLLVGLIGVSMLGALILPLGGRSIAYALIGIILFSSTYQSLMYVYDTWSIRLREDGAKLHFGFTRSFGSFMYASTAAVFGAAADRFGLGIMTPSYILLAAAVIALTLSIREPQMAAGPAVPKDSFHSGVKKLLKNRAYLALLAAVFLCFFGSIGSTIFLVLRIGELGGGNGEYGVALFIMACAEIPALLLYSRLSARFSHLFLLSCAMVSMSLKIAGIAFSPALWMIIAIQVLQGPSYGLYLSAIANYVPTIVEKRTVFTAQTLLASMVSGLAGICASLYMGALSPALGLSASIGILSVFPLAGLFILRTFTGKRPAGRP